MLFFFHDFAFSKILSRVCQIKSVIFCLEVFFIKEYVSSSQSQICHSFHPSKSAFCFSDVKKESDQFHSALPGGLCFKFTSVPSLFQYWFLTNIKNICLHKVAEVSLWSPDISYLCRVQPVEVLSLWFIWSSAQNKSISLCHNVIPC